MSSPSALSTWSNVLSPRTSETGGQEFVDFAEAHYHNEEDDLTCRICQGDTTLQWLVSNVKRLLEMEKIWEEDEVKAGLKEEDLVKKIQQLDLELKSAKTKSNAEEPPKVLDPESRDGQCVGAVLRIKMQTDSRLLQNFAAGDYVIVKGHGLWDVQVKNMRTTAEARIEWESFFPSTSRNKYVCAQRLVRHCLCMHENS